MKSILPTLTLFLIVLAACETSKKQEIYEKPALLFDEELAPFYYGVASGDPMATSVVLWTKVVPEFKVPEVEIKWRISTDKNFNSIVQSGTEILDSTSQYTFKNVVNELFPATYYYYQFEALGEESVIGRTKTAPEASADSLKFAIVSCSNYEAGFFNAYGHIGERNDLDAVIHLGDYIYEYAPGVYGDSSTRRFHKPPKELITLSDYRIRYAQYRLDKNLMKAHQMHPFITVWDDHEIANNNYKSGAENHQPEEGDFQDRLENAKKAYYEWLPVTPSEKLYRNLKYGSLASIIMLDERTEGRTKQPESMDDPAYEDENQAMLGTEQTNWFFDQLAENTKWKIIGNQVIFTDLDISGAFPERPRNMDSWDGYPKEKFKIADHIRYNEIENVIFVTGDTHCSWAFETTLDPKEKYDPFAVEFGTPSVTSANYDEYTTSDTVEFVSFAYLAANPQLKYCNLTDHGYLLITLKDEEAMAEWFYAEGILIPYQEMKHGMTFHVKDGSNKLQ